MDLCVHVMQPLSQPVTLPSTYQWLGVCFMIGCNTQQS